MRVFLDDNIPDAIRRDLPGHEVSSVEQEGWKGTQNGRLLALVERSFDVMVTADTGLSFQNELSSRQLSIVVLPTNRLPILRHNPLPLRRTLDELESHRRHCFIRIRWNGRRWRRWLDEEPLLDQELVPVPAFRRPRG